MKKPTPKPTSFPPTSVRLDPDLLYVAEKLALENKRAGLPDKTMSKVVNAALAKYLKGRTDTTS